MSKFYYKMFASHPDCRNASRNRIVIGRLVQEQKEKNITPIDMCSVLGTFRNMDLGELKISALLKCHRGRMTGQKPG
jgi:hypothetical protein